MARLPNPLIPGFNPDPSVVLVDGVYYLVTSTFEYVPGLPIYRSTDLVEWEHVGNVGNRLEQLEIGDVISGLGVFAPTIRHHDGTFYVIVTIMQSPKGCVVYTTTDPAGPWTDGLTIEGLTGIDPDLAWDDDGTAYVTFSGLGIGSDDGTGFNHAGIVQARVDLSTGTLLEEPRTLWSGTGGQFPEAPHLYRRGEHWYLVIAEGGTERGHAVSVARGTSPEGPFEGHPANPIVTARGTNRPIQNTGHADLVDTPDGGSALVLLGVRPIRYGSPLGRETFATPVRWQDGWPYAEPVELAPRAGTFEEHFPLADPAELEDPGWLAVRQTPQSLASVADRRLVMEGGPPMSEKHPRFVGRRQRHLRSTTSVTVDASAGAGGLAVRWDHNHWFGLELQGRAVTAIASVARFSHTWHSEVPDGDIVLRIETDVPTLALDETALSIGGDLVRLWANDTLLAELDGRYWTMEIASPFVGRVAGMFATRGTVAFTDYRYSGTDAP